MADCLYNLDCNFLTEINNALGGTSATIGYISAFTAIVEVPVMVFFVPVFGKMRESTLMRFAFVMFVFKMLAYALSFHSGAVCRPHPAGTQLRAVHRGHRSLCIQGDRAPWCQ